MEQKKLSTTFKLLRALGFNYSEEEYGDVSLWRVIWQFFHNIRQGLFTGNTYIMDQLRENFPCIIFSTGYQPVPPISLFQEYPV